jgi:hypothetical protein
MHRIAERVPAARFGAVEVRPVVRFDEWTAVEPQSS